MTLLRESFVLLASLCHKRVVFVGLIVLFVVAGAVFGTTRGDQTGHVPPAITPMDPTLVLGYSTCAKCHPNEIEVWKGTPHYATFEELHRRPEAKQIAQKLGVSSIKYDGRCISCHYTQKTENGEVSAISGISCESCHGPAKNWIDLHYNYGGAGITRESESKEHREKRIADSIAAGMRNPHNIYTMAQSCMKCHTVPDEELVNVGGHSSGSLDFEMVSWSEGMVRHRFLAGGGTHNAKHTAEELNLLFVSGMIADLEFSLRATSNATSKSTYGYTVAKRASAVAKRLASVYKKTQIPLLREIIETYMSVPLSINNADALNDAADKIAKLGYQFAEEHTGAELTAIQPYVPGEERWLQQQ
ncbi:cytochrome c family protein [Rosistilla oblonga]|uniref:cytochrome c family protein n=1 Tax=Rosistilla oblonga TaxID=2527990 RepID=UPI003A96CAA0